MQFSGIDPLFYKFGDAHKSKKKGYWFPYEVKYLGWLVAVSLIVTCSVLLALYGTTFGLVKCYLWLTAELMSIGVTLSFLQPIRIVLLSYIFAAFFKSPPGLEFKRIPDTILENPYDEKKAFSVQKLRQDNTQFYSPIPKYKLESRAANIKFHIEQRTLFVEVFIFVLFVFILTYLVVAHQSRAAYHTTEVVKHLIVDGSYTKSIPFTKVSSYSQFMEYLNETFLPSLYGSTHRDLHIDYSYYRKDKWRNGTNEKWKRQASKIPLTDWDEASLSDVRERFQRSTNESQKNVTNLYQRSWTMDRSVKMIGKPRLRQHRVKNHTCKTIKYIQPREGICFGDYSAANREDRDFYLWWGPVVDERLTPNELKPWLYQSDWETGEVYLIGKYSSYPAGGYILELAKNLEDSRVILDFMDAFWWIDARTRAVIIELTLYCVNVNLFSVIHLIAEKSATGYFIPSYQIRTAKFMFLFSELQAITIVMMLAFNALLVLFIYRQAIRIQRTSIKSYLTEGNPAVDVLIIILGLLTILSMFLRSFYVAQLLKKLDSTQNYEFISFTYAAVWNEISNYMNTAMVVLSAIKLIQLLRFRVTFLQLQEPVHISIDIFFSILLHFLVILIAFTFLFHLTLAPYDFHFSTFIRTLMTLLTRMFYFDYDADVYSLENAPWVMVPVFFVGLVSVTAFFFITCFLSIIIHQFKRVKTTRIRNKYSALAYLKHMLTAGPRTDIMRLKGGCSLFNDSTRVESLRLRGGGTIFARCCMGNHERYELPPKFVADREVIKRWNPKCVVPKPYDFFPAYEVKDLYRFDAMKKITKAAIQEKLNVSEEKYREQVMEAYVARRLNPIVRSPPEKFYRVVDGNTLSVVSSRRISDIKFLINTYGRSKIEENYKKINFKFEVIKEEFQDSVNLEELNEKAEELEKIVDMKYKEEKRRKSEERRASRSSKSEGGQKRSKKKKSGKTIAKDDKQEEERTGTKVRRSKPGMESEGGKKPKEGRLNSVRQDEKPKGKERSKDEMGSRGEAVDETPNVEM